MRGSSGGSNGRRVMRPRQGGDQDGNPGVHLRGMAHAEELEDVGGRSVLGRAKQEGTSPAIPDPGTTLVGARADKTLSMSCRRTRAAGSYSVQQTDRSAESSRAWIGDENCRTTWSELLCDGSCAWRRSMSGRCSPSGSLTLPEPNVADGVSQSRARQRRASCLSRRRLSSDWRRLVQRGGPTLTLSILPSIARHNARSWGSQASQSSSSTNVRMLITPAPRSPAIEGPPCWCRL